MLRHLASDYWYTFTGFQNNLWAKNVSINVARRCLWVIPWQYENFPEQYWYFVQDFLPCRWKRDKGHTQLYFYQYHLHLWMVYIDISGKRRTGLGTINDLKRYHSYDPIEFWMKIILDPIDTHEILHLQSNNITRLPTLDLWPTILGRWFGSLAHFTNLSENKKSKFRQKFKFGRELCVSVFEFR